MAVRVIITPDPAFTEPAPPRRYERLKRPPYGVRRPQRRRIVTRSSGRHTGIVECVAVEGICKIVHLQASVFSWTTSCRIDAGLKRKALRDLTFVSGINSKNLYAK